MKETEAALQAFTLPPPPVLKAEVSDDCCSLHLDLTCTDWPFPAPAGVYIFLRCGENTAFINSQKCLHKCLNTQKMMNSSINEFISPNWRIYHDPSGQGRTADRERQNTQWNISVFLTTAINILQRARCQLFRLQLLTCSLKSYCNKEEISLAQLQLYSLLPFFK